MNTTQTKFKMRVLMVLTVLLILPAYAICTPFTASNQTAPVINYGIISEFQWDSPLLEKKLNCLVYSPDTPEGKKPVVVYLKNLPGPR